MVDGVEYYLIHRGAVIQMLCYDDKFEILILTIQLYELDNIKKIQFY